MNRQLSPRTVPVQQAHAPFELLVEEATQWTKRPHQHNFFELVFIEEGEGRQCINHQQVAYQRHNVFLLPPLDCHSFDITTPTRFVFLRFTNQAFAPYQHGALDCKAWFQQLSYVLLNYNRVPGEVVHSGRDKQHLLHALQLIRDEHARPDAFSPVLVQTALVTILNLLVRNIEAALLTGATGAAAPDRRFLQVLNYIQHHLFDHAALRVPALAEQASMSPTYFSEYFRAHAGESLQTYLTTSRLKLAEARLLHSDSSAKEIAAELGFTDTSHFSRTFKKVYGCTIQAFRQRGAFHLLRSEDDAA